jgi:pimeloyl-ACP methyl ester carboxylesterase
MAGGLDRWVRARIEQLAAASEVAQTPRGPIEYAAAGEGPVVLVVHGTPGGYDQGQLIWEDLKGAPFRTIAVSRPGYLRTPLEVGRTPAEQSDAFAALLDALGVHRAAVVAVSGGGPSSIQFALRHKERCWGLVLISALAGPRPQEQRPLAMRLFYRLVLESDAAGRFLVGVSNLVPDWLARGSRPPGARERERRLLATLVPASARRAGIQNDLAQHSVLPATPIGPLSTPALVIHGAADRLVTPTHAEAAARIFPGAEVILVPGAGHDVFFQRGQELAPRVRAFLGSHAPLA